MGGGLGPKEEGAGCEEVWVLRGRRWMGGGVGPMRKEMDRRRSGS
jgi:hypothetical protein